MERTIAVYNESGGVGKTVTAVNTAAALAQQGADVLAIDLDPQPGGLTAHTGVDDTPAAQPEADLHLGDALADPEKTPVQKLVYDAGAIDVIPSNEALADADLYLGADSDIRMEEFQLQAALSQGMYGAYDYIIADPQPSAGTLVDNAICAMRNVIAPVELTAKGRRSVEAVRRTLTEMEKDFTRLQDDFEVSLLAVVPNRVRDASIADRVRHRLREDGVPVTRFEIRQRAVLTYAWDEGRDIFEHAEETDLRDYERDVLDAYERLATIVEAGGVAAAGEDIDLEADPDDSADAEEVTAS